MRPLRLKARVRPRDTLRGSKAAPNRAELDKLCRTVVFYRDGGACRKCGKTTGQLHWAHIYSRRFLSVRWNELNSMVLCAGCHLFCHHNPIEGGEFFKAELGEQIYNGLRTLRNAGLAPNRMAIKLHLTKLLGDSW